MNKVAEETVVNPALSNSSATKHCSWNNCPPLVLKADSNPPPTGDNLPYGARFSISKLSTRLTRAYTYVAMTKNAEDVHFHGGDWLDFGFISRVVKQVGIFRQNRAFIRLHRKQESCIY